MSPGKFVVPRPNQPLRHLPSTHIDRHPRWVYQIAVGANTVRRSFDTTLVPTPEAKESHDRFDSPLLDKTCDSPGRAGSLSYFTPCGPRMPVAEGIRLAPERTTPALGGQSRRRKSCAIP